MEDQKENTQKSSGGNFFLRIFWYWVHILSTVIHVMATFIGWGFAIRLIIFADGWLGICYICTCTCVHFIFKRLYDESELRHEYHRLYYKEMDYPEYLKYKENERNAMGAMRYTR